MGKKNSKTTNWYRSEKKSAIFMIVVLLIVLVEVHLTGFARYGYNVVRCGGLPVKSTYNPFGGGYMNYNVPGSTDYVPGGGAGVKYYCTPDEAEADGIRPNPFTKEGVEREKKFEGQDQKPWEY